MTAEGRRPAASEGPPPIRIIFVCTGNICRSPLAEAVFGAIAARRGVADRFRLASAGTTAYHEGEAADHRMRATARRHGVTIRNRSAMLRDSDLATNDLILAMDLENIRTMQSRFRAPFARVRLFREFDPEPDGTEVPDPYYGGQHGFEQVFGIVDRTCRAMIDQFERGGRAALLSNVTSQPYRPAE